MIIDATDNIVGRLGTFVAKQALLGEKIDIVNAEKAVISGARAGVLGKYKQNLDRRTWSKGPHMPRDADRLLKRMIRNMLPFKQPKGEVAFKNITCWLGVPEQFKDQKLDIIESAKTSGVSNADYTQLKDISKILGGNVE